MAAPTSADFARVSALLQEGKTQEADDLLKELTSDAAKAERAAAGIPETPSPPRAPEAIVLDFFHSITAHLGFPPKLHALLDELKAVAS